MTEKEQAAAQIMVCQAALNKGSAGKWYDLHEAGRIAKATGYKDVHEIAESINVRAQHPERTKEMMRHFQSKM